MKVHIAVIAHAHGHDVLAAKTHGKLKGKVLAYARTNWREELGPISKSRDKAIDAYFAGTPGEELVEEEVEV